MATMPLSPDDAVALPLPAPRDELRRYRRAAVVVLALLVGGLGGTAAVIDVTSAVVAYGDVTVDTKIKKIAHPTGGVIAQVAVRDGDRVKAGDVLMRLDTAVSQIGAETSGGTLEQMLAMQARLTAERDGARAVAYPVALTRSTSSGAATAMAEESRLFALRRAARAGQRRELAERIAQAEQQIASYRTQIAASHAQLDLIGPELAGIRSLYERKLTTLNRVNELERTAVSLTASGASLAANIAQARSQISEIRQQIIQVDQAARSDAGTALTDITARLSEQHLRQATAKDAVDRSVIRAPQSGVVDRLAFTTIGGVIPPAVTILEIVPDTDRLTIEAKVSPRDINQIHPHQRAMLRFSAFNVRTTPEVEGELRQISANRATDERTGTSYYTVLIDLRAGEMAKLGDVKLVPGMPVEAYVATGSRSLLSYLVKPFRDQLARAFREA